MKKNANNKPQGQSNRPDKLNPKDLNKKIADLEVFNISIGVHIKELEKIVRARRVVMTKRLYQSELHDLRLQLADLQFLHDLTEIQIESLTNYALYLEKRKKLFGF